ncbi:hypothetical protein [Klebsiella quasipneumoniae]|uniref:hypothetical protein n=1 Tax=Klebsiella quasipneumoniae TaxID=1463165 RepID=UPI00388CF455
MHQTKKGNQWHFGERPTFGVDAKSGPDPLWSPPRPTSMTSISWVICFMERTICVSADAGYQGAPQREAGRGGCGLAIAERPGRVKTLKQHPRKEQNGHQHRIHESQHRAVEHPVSHHQATVSAFVKARYKGLLKNDNQLAMLFTLANLFRADQMIRQWERSH